MPSPPEGVVYSYTLDGEPECRPNLIVGGSADDGPLDLAAFLADPAGLEAAWGEPYRYDPSAADAKLGWILFGHHYYDPTPGRWPSEDPLGLLATDADLYRYPPPPPGDPTP